MTDTIPFDFTAAFEALTGRVPFPWQTKLFEEFIAGNIPSSCNLPTGLGKTSVIAIWLIALANCPEKMPRRLIYVVNRRTVVDQTTEEVEKLRKRLIDPRKHVKNESHIALLESLVTTLAQRSATGASTPLAISTLRGQYADNREWSEDPTRPAVICGTVDMIGSRLLFEGYGIGFKGRPLHAGFLGQDALLVHDEAHLEPAFQKLVESVENEQRQKEQTNNLAWPKLRVMALSATARITKNGQQEVEVPFELTVEEKDIPQNIPDPPIKPIHHVWRRLKAKKSLHFHPIVDEKKLAEKVANLALEHKTAGVPVLVYVRTVDDVNNVCEVLTGENGVPAERVQKLTGTIRGYERDKLIDHPTFKRFLPNPPDDAANETVYLVCTSAGEVGVNISGYHMVCDLTTFESEAQRLGRVNRFGDFPDSRIDVVYAESFDDKSPNPQRKATLALLKQLQDDASPQALIKLKESFTPTQLELPVLTVDDAEYQRRREYLAKKLIASAFSPEPAMLDATDILFDAWALTTIRGKMPGRPPVAPYLHGIADDLPQITIAWRAELDLVKAESPRAAKALQAIFTKHRIRPHESLAVGMTQVRGNWVYRALNFLEQATAKRPDLRNAPIAIQVSREFSLTTVGSLLASRQLLDAEPTLILPASFGGLDETGTLSADAISKLPESPTEPEGGEVASPTLDIADIDGYEPYKDVPTRIRVVIDRTNDGWAARGMPRGRPLPNWRLKAVYPSSTQLVDRIRKESGLNVRLVQSIAWDEDENPIRAIVCLSPAPKRGPSEDQFLEKHVAAVECEAGRLADALKLPEPIRSALLFAAKWHDEGKKAERWQRYIGRQAGEPPLGKSAKWRDPKLLGGYRHEFGSLMRIRRDEDECKAFFSNPQLNLTPDQQDQGIDLALHLIAAHHGYGRPHFLNPIDDDYDTTACERIHVEVMARYARLQRGYGRWGLAYAESLLRAADAAASRSMGFDMETDTDDVTELEGAEQ